MPVKTVVSQTQTDVTSYSSGPLDVSDFHELMIDLTITSGKAGTPLIHEDYTPVSGTFAYSFAIYRLTPTDIPVLLIGPWQVLSQWVDGDTPVYPSGLTSIPISTQFGDRITVELDNPQGVQISFRLDITGK